MAGGVSKGFGILLILIGALALLGAIGGAAYALMDEQDNQEGLLSDGQRSDTNNQILIGAGVAGGAGLVFLLLGIILVAVGASAARREMMQAVRTVPPAHSPATSPASAPVDEDAPSSRVKTWAVLGVAGLLLIAGIVVLASQFDGNAGASPESLSTEPQRGAFLSKESFDGAVRMGVSVPGQSQTFDTSASQREFKAPGSTAAMILNLTWSTQPQGTSQLLVIVEIQQDGAWRELGREGGASPVSLDVYDAVLDGASLRYRVFAQGSAAAAYDQPFKVEVSFFQA